MTLRARRIGYVTLLLSSVTRSPAAGAQASRGRTLAPLPASLPACRSGTATAEMQRLGMVRVVTLEIAGPPHRSLTVGTGLRGNAVTLTDQVDPAPAMKVVGESSSVTFANGGALRTGERRTAGPGGHRVPMSPSEGERAFAFAKQVLRSCSRR